MQNTLMKATLIALCFSGAACTTLPPSSTPDQPKVTDTAEATCPQKSVKGALSGSATQAVLDGIGKKLNITGLGKTGGRAVEAKLNCP